MIRRRDLARALERKRIADWVIFESTQDIGIADGLRRDALTRRRENRARITLVVHVDDSRGRGTARVEIGSQDDGAAEIVDRATELALATIGPAWKSVPASAPAKVTLVDPDLEKRDVQFVAVELVKSLAVPASVRVTRDQIVVDTKAGLTTRWTTSTFELDALIGDDTHSIAVHREARRRSDLELEATLAAAADDLKLFAEAGAVSSGPCTLVLDANAFLHDDTTGVWSVFATQADAVLERQGLTRYRPGVPVAPGADVVPEPLTIESNGALDFGMRSAPIGEHGDAVRKFVIVERGTAKDLGLSPREAALRGRDPNGGVRNLVVGKGTWDGAIATGTGSARTIEVRRLRGLTIDPYTGEASLELAIAREHGGGKPQVFSGGTVRLDLVAALARARRSTETIHRGAYHGPTRISIDGLHLIV